MLRDFLLLETSWEKLKKSPLPVVVYGTGNGADRVFDEFSRLGITVSAVTASDGFVRKRTFRGFEVKSLSQAENELGDFIVALAFASPLPQVIENIKKLSLRHTVIMPSVPVYGDNIFNRAFFEAHFSEIEQAFSRLADEQSRKVFLSIIKFQLTGDLSFAFACETDKDEAFSLLSLGDGESYLDLGAYKGDTVSEFLSYTDGYSYICAVEPDLKNFKKLSENCGQLSNISFINSAVWSFSGEIPFAGSRGRGGSKNEQGKKIPCITVDSLNRNFSYIKADVEGAEKEMLAGAVNTLKAHKPKLNIAAYHRSEDLFFLVNKIAEINGGYKIYLRHHPHISFWDTNLYCI